MLRQSPMGTAAPKSMGAASKVAPGWNVAPKKAAAKNTRDYGKPLPAAPTAPLQGAPSPFGPTDGGSRIGGI